MILALGIVIGLGAPDRFRLLALVPVGTAAGIILYVVAGGPIMLVTWLSAGVLVLALPTDSRARTTTT